MKQIIVTKKGQGIIPKALANGEVVKFTKVCISDKDYAGVELCNLEKIENVKQEANIDYVHILSDTQIEVVCGLDNEKLNDAYYIRTIGIYAEDSKGNEILYGVSISADTPKYMPRYEGKTLTGILYRLTINIDNAENVITDVNNATVANVLEVQLIEKRVSALESDIKQLSNPNLLINSSFRVSELVNQRGERIYLSNGASIKPKFDMWNMSSVNTNINFNANLENEFVKLSITNNNEINSYGTLMQKIENVSELTGKTVTVSARVKFNVDGYPFLFGFGSSYGGNVILNSSKEWQTIKYTTTIPSHKGSLYTVMQLKGNNACSVEIEYMKLELGEIATPFVDDDYTTKLTKCKRYLQKISGLRNVGNGIVRTTSTTDSAILILKLDTPMRIDTPSLSVNNVNMILTGYPMSLKSITGLTYLFPRATESNITFLVSVANTTGLSLNSPVIVQFLSSDDCILLSAEL